MNNKGWSVSIIMSLIAYTVNIRDPIAFVWIISTARFVYGLDRFIDKKTDDNIINIITALFISFTILCYKDLELFMLPELLSILYYQSFKQNFAIYKSLYVGSAWGISTCVVPQLISNTDINVLNVIMITLLSTSVSNFADIEDIKDDKNNNILTIPVKYGRRKAIQFSILTGLSSTPLIARNVNRKQYIQKQYSKKNNIKNTIMYNMPELKCYVNKTYFNYAIL